MKRHGFSLRRRTTVSKRLPKDLVPKVTLFIMATRQLQHLKDYPLGSIGNMDEAPLWLDMPGATTITHSGERSVSVGTTGHEKNLFTICLSAMADGRKSKPYVVFKGKRQIPKLQQVPGVVVALSNNGWMNEDLTKDWLRRCCGTLNFRRRLLVWNAYKCHLTDGVRNVANKSTNSDMAIIPGGLTGHIHPADVCWNQPFKEAYKELYGEWTATGEKSYTQAGNIHAPSKLQCLEWVKKAWESVSQDIVIKSFRCCGISVKVDGTEDKEIHCIKDGGIAAEAIAEISQHKAALLASE